jgi:Raf kinase inhibitor-like YbhB/YbcL family protein
MNPALVQGSMVLALLGSHAAGAMSLTSNDIAASGPIAKAHIYSRCGGENISPQLAWTGAPTKTKSYVLTMIDLDVKPSQWSHWVVTNLPVTATTLARGAQALPGNAQAIASNFGDAAYAGPCPPRGTGLHRYQFTIWAMPTASTTLAPDTKATAISSALLRLALDHASLIGTVEAPAD